jgi:hypothetical protein
MSRDSDDIEKQGITRDSLDLDSDTEELILEPIVISQRGSCKRLYEKWRKIHMCLRISIIFGLVIILGLTVYLIRDFGGNGVDASYHFHSGPGRGDYCSENKYGCCEIYNSCEDKHTYVDSESTKISMIRVIPRDIHHSNCPSLEYLIAEYNIHYNQNVTDCGDFGCCFNLEVGCDKTIRNTFRRGNNAETSSLLGSTHKIMPIFIQKKDKQGSNCGSEYNIRKTIINSYVDGYPPESSDDSIMIVLVIMIGLLCLLSLPSN